MLVEEVMTRNVFTVESNKNMFDVCKEFSKHKVGSLVVMNKKIIVGIVTERDVIERVILENKDLKKTKVRDIMSPHIKTIHALAPLEKAAQIMQEHNIKKLPVVLNNEIVGIVTETDLSRTIEAFSEAVEELARFYSDSRANLEKMMDDWGDILINLKSYKRLTENKEIDIVKEEVE
jgi:CBS domain-containing protein